MEPRILFSPVGLTDPICNLYDGPLLHIVRHYRPDTVYLFITAEMAKYDRLDDRYAKCVLAIHPSCRIIKLETDIQNPNNFDRFIGLFSHYLEQIASENVKSRIIVNLTSGTPQMLLALALEAVLSPFDLLALQVDTPDNRSDINNHPIGAKFSVTDQLAYNLDQQDPANPNRCRILPLAILKKNNTKHSILSLIDRYEYEGALAQYDATKNIFSPVIASLLRHACARESLNLKVAKQQTKLCPSHVNLFPVQEVIPQLLTEYFMVMTISQRRGQLSDFLLKVTPFLFRLTKHYLETTLRFPLGQFTTLRYGFIYLDADKVSLMPHLLQSFRNKFGSNFRSSELSFTNLLPILDYLVTDKGKHGSPDQELVSRLHQLQAYERYIRNEVAHTINAIDEKTFTDTAQKLHRQDPSFSYSMTSARLLDEIESAMHAMLGAAVKNYSFVYDSINQELHNLLNT